jgi:hypothetical protein
MPIPEFTENIAFVQSNAPLYVGFLLFRVTHAYTLNLFFMYIF